jgi:uncharacterized protein YacL
MKQVIANFIAHRDLYMISITLGSVFTAITSTFVKFTPSYVFGISITLWIAALVINLVDIYTGIKASSKKRKTQEKFLYSKAERLGEDLKKYLSLR